MPKQFIVHAPPGLGLDLDLHARVIRAVPTISEHDEYLVIEPKPDTGSDESQSTAPAPDGAPGGRTWPIPPIIMSFRLRNAIAANLAGAAYQRLSGAISLDAIADRLARMDEDATHVAVIEPDHGR